jgi:hypothetical protein
MERSFLSGRKEGGGSGLVEGFRPHSEGLRHFVPTLGTFFPGEVVFSRVAQGWDSMGPAADPS